MWISIAIPFLAMKNWNKSNCSIILNISTFLAGILWEQTLRLGCWLGIWEVIPGNRTGKMEKVRWMKEKIQCGFQKWAGYCTSIPLRTSAELQSMYLVMSQPSQHRTGSRGIYPPTLIPHWWGSSINASICLGCTFLCLGSICSFGESRAKMWHSLYLMWDTVKSAWNCPIQPCEYQMG